MKPLVFIIFLGFFLLYSCKKGLFDAGDSISKEFKLEDDIWVCEIQNIFEITLIKDTVNKATAFCGKNIMSDVDIKSSEHILYLNHNVHFDWTRKYEKIKILLHLKDIPRLNIHQPVKIVTLDTFKTNYFAFVVWNQFAEIDVTVKANYLEMNTSLDDFGRYLFHGTCKNSDLNPSGSGMLDCRNMVIENCKIWQRSMADAYLNVSKKLTVKFEGKGNIYYTGNPDSVILLNQPSKGKLLKW